MTQNVTEKQQDGEKVKIKLIQKGKLPNSLNEKPKTAKNKEIKTKHKI